MSYRSFVEATLKGLREGDELPDYFGCLSSTVAQFLPASFVHQEESSIDQGKPQQNTTPDRPRSRNSPVRQPLNQIPQTKRRFDIEEEEETSEINDSIHPTHREPSISPIKKSQDSPQKVSTDSLQRAPVQQPPQNNFNNIEEEEEEDIDEPIIQQKLPPMMRNFMEMSEEEEEEDDIPKPIGLDNPTHISPNVHQASPVLRKQAESSNSPLAEQNNKPKSKYLLDSTNQDSDSYDDGPFPAPQKQKQKLDIFPKPKPKVKPLAQDYCSIFQNTIDTAYEHFWPKMNTTVPRVTQESKIYNLTNPLKYVKLIKTLETKYAKHDPGKLTFKRRESTEIKEDYDEDDFEEPGF